MRLLARLSLLALLACGAGTPEGKGGASQTSSSQAGNDPNGEKPLPASVVRDRWGKLANDELDLGLALDAMATTAPEAKLTNLQPMRANAGLLIAGIARLNPPPELAACQSAALASAKTVRASLDTINELWMGRLPRAENARAQANAIVADLCGAFARMRRAREECGVLPAPDARGPRPKSVACPDN